MKGKEWRRLLEIARAFDPDPRRGRLRDAIESDDKDVATALVRERDALDQTTAQSLALLLSFFGMPQEAIELLDPLVLRFPDDFWLRYRYGRVLWNQSRSREAARHLQAAVALRPHSAGAWNMLGLAFAGSHEFESSLHAYHRSLERHQGKWLVLMNIGYVYSRTGRNKEAIAVLEESNRLTDKHADAAQWLAGHLKSEDRLDEAEEWYRRSVEIHPTWWDNRRNFARLLTSRGKFEEALEQAKKARELDPTRVAESTDTVPQRMLELEPQLDACLERPIEKEPLELLLDFANLCHFTGKHEECVRLLREAQRREPDIRLQGPHKYRAAFAAVRAARRSEPAAAREYRDLALRWLRRELRQDESELDDLDADTREARGQELNWTMYRAPGLKPVRKDALDALPAGEREAWAAHWREVERVMWLAWENAGG